MDLDATVPGHHTPATLKVRRFDERLPAHLTFIELVARGGMSSLLLVEDTRSGRRVAAKLVDLPPGSTDHRARYRREVELGVRFAHAGVVPVLDHDDALGVIVLPFLAGGTLEWRLRHRGPMPPSDVRSLARQLLGTLIELHAAGVVHRDIKPSNILFDEADRPYVADLGVAHDDKSTLTLTGMVIGTPAYMAPEQLRGRAVDGHADVFALGATLFEAATGLRHADLDAGVDAGAVVATRTRDRGLGAAIGAMLAPDPDLRPSAVEARAMLEGTHARRRVRGLPLLWAALCCGAFAAVGVVTADVGAVAVLPVAGDGLSARTSVGVGQLLAVRLAEAGVVTVGPLELRERAHSDGRDALRAAASSTASRIIDGRAEATAGGRVRLTLTLSRVGARRSEWESVDEVAAGDVLAAAAHRSEELALRLARPKVGAEQALADAQRELNDSRWGEALDALARAEALAGRTADVLTMRAVASWWASRPEPETRAAVTAALDVEVRPHKRSFLEGLAMFLDGRFAEAVAHFEAALREAPGDRDLLYGLFEAEWHAGETSDAIAVYRRLVERYPDFRMAEYHVLTHALITDDRSEQEWAFDHWKLTDDAGFNWQIARARLQQGDADGAITVLLSATQRWPTQDVPKEELGLTYATLGEMALARAVLVSMKPVRPDLARMLARVSGDDAALRALLNTATAELGREDADTLLGGAVAVVSLETDASRIPAVIADVQRRLTMTLMGSSKGKELLLIADAAAPTGGAERTVDDGNHEMRALARGLVARHAGNFAEARERFREAAAHTNGRVLILEHGLEAEACEALGDDAGVLAACAPVIAPRGDALLWSAWVGPCLLRSARAAAHLGRRDEAEHDAALLLKQRIAAPADDALVVGARAIIAHP